MFQGVSSDTSPTRQRPCEVEVIKAADKARSQRAANARAKANIWRVESWSCISQRTPQRLVLMFVLIKFSLRVHTSSGLTGKTLLCRKHLKRRKKKPPDDTETTDGSHRNVWPTRAKWLADSHRMSAATTPNTSYSRCPKIYRLKMVVIFITKSTR